MPTTLITGANRGIGLEFARQYAAEGWRVLACCRAPERAEALGALGGDIRIERLDVTDFAGLGALAARLSAERIDLLVNNAGVYGPRDVALGQVDPAAWLDVLRTNAVAPLKVAEAFREQVAASEGRTIVAITSHMGSIGDNGSGGAYIYRSSKAALNAAMRSLAIDLGARGITVAVLHPGWVKTDMGGPGAAIAPETSVAGMRRVIARLSLADSGRFFNYDGTAIPW
ncbi:MAG: SDR family oxidoreductase [Proteobacteria bacterium]|nr:SDR family oxidoreductase [Pseudomonadota bacterium]